MKQTFQLIKERVQTPETDLPTWSWGMGAALIAIYGVVLPAALLFVTSITGASLSSPEPDTLAYASFMGAIVMLMLIFQYTNLALARGREQKQTRGTMSLTEALRLIPSKNTPLYAVMLIAFIVALLTDTIGFLLGVPISALPLPLDGLTPGSGIPFLIAALVVAVLRPIVEELIFRGVFYTGLLKQFTQVQAIVISALVFAIFHFLFDPAYVWWGFVQPLVLGLTAGIVRAATQSTQAAIGAHFMFGFFVVLRALLGA